MPAVQQSRRGFLIGTATVLASPAIVKIESLMKIWVPPQDLMIPINLQDYGLMYKIIREMVRDWENSPGFGINLDTEYVRVFGGPDHAVI